MDVDLEQLAEDYLDGLLSAKEANWLEHNLVRPEVGAVFTEALILRELLRTVGPDLMPEGLVERLEEAVLSQLPREQRRSLLSGGTRSILSGLSWAVRGPALAVPSGRSGTRETLSGLGTVRYTLGALANRPATQEAAPKEKKRPLWRRVLRRRK